MTLREQLLENNKPALKPVTINGAAYYIRELTVGETNQALYGQRQQYIKLAQAQGIELNFEDEEELAKQLQQIYDPYALARTIAVRLCDEDGNNLFNAENDEDLALLSGLDTAIFTELNKALVGSQPKNLTPDASSN